MVSLSLLFLRLGEGGLSECTAVGEACRLLSVREASSAIRNCNKTGIKCVLRDLNTQDKVE